MSSYQELIGQAMFGRDIEGNKVSRDCAEARLSCKIAASTAIFCQCCQSSILDQQTVTVITVDFGEDDRLMRAYCPRCMSAKRAGIVSAAREKGYPVVFETWGGRETI